MMANQATKSTNPPKGECQQCWYHAYALHRGNWLGLWREPECEPCLDHMRNGCPDHMIVE